MHFPIIKFESIDSDKKDWDINLPFEDPCLTEHTDYYGDLYSEEERKNVIHSKWLKELFEGIATINEEEETITILDSDTVRNTLNKYYEEIVDELKQLADAEKLTPYQIRRAGESYKDFDTLFYYGYGRTSFDFIEDCLYMPGTTLRIGNIFDAHF